jgi:hypothetical protein
MARHFLLLFGVWKGTVIQQASYVMGTWGFFPRTRNGPGVKLTTHFHAVLRTRTVEQYLHSPIRLHGVALN